MKYARCLYVLIIMVLPMILTSCFKTTEREFEDQANQGYELKNTMAYPTWYNPANLDTLTLVTWNVAHFVDAYDNPYIDNRREDEPSEELEERYQLLAEALRKIDADVVVFQELESDSFLKAFADDYLPNMNYRVFAALESPDWYMNVVMMSRVPMGMFYSYAHINTPIPGHLDVDGQPASQTFINNRMWTADLLINDNYSLSITGAHLKAGRGERNQAWRMGQMALIRNHLSQLMKSNPRRNILIMGDLNSTPDSPEFKELLGEDTPKFVDPLAGTNVYSHPSDSAFWRIDHILPNKEALNEVVSKSVKVVRPLSEKQMIMISDHLPLKARLVTKDL